MKQNTPCCPPPIAINWLYARKHGGGNKKQRTSSLSFRSFAVERLSRDTLCWLSIDLRGSAESAVISDLLQRAVQMLSTRLVRVHRAATHLPAPWRRWCRKCSELVTRTDLIMPWRAFATPQRWFLFVKRPEGPELVTSSNHMLFV